MFIPVGTPKRSDKKDNADFGYAQQDDVNKLKTKLAHLTTKVDMVVHSLLLVLFFGLGIAIANILFILVDMIS